ncbi:uncharacterized protein BCR38DRAFT_119936 [Pseudomassariella vexata]|uniref:Putative lipoate-protein ligase A n=1 Tax=Pseudomassariella vexata TaxID=1141098 RepID=A0A1Y2DA07_9PEZI|nr:uncharacterized protein BCR38DRAFT_119936 [Pseudomassariella vexata]ORY56100.1 hypothetical protein BCR38DRAFT_119936 [Pseudomassariella vexata]
MASLNRLLARSRVPRLANIRRFSEAVSHPSNRVQAYVSRSSDPYLNLSVEHYLLQKSAPESVVLFLYTNSPCVVIGRNQNPWLEVNLGLLNRAGLLAKTQGSSDDADEGVALVRRRSGGGTVFHDEGNVNYSVICPSAAFDRNKHAEMVVRALRSLGAESTRVNERHDIVLDVSALASSSGGGAETYKISGSAYKLTRLRSLHHGTCLLSTPNLSRISQFLRSPAEPFLKSRGVDSVRSKIQNVRVANRDFEEAVVAEFGGMYGDVDAEIITAGEARHVPDVMKGYEELKSPKWIYEQTPRFTFATHPTEEDPRERPDLPDYLPKDFKASLVVRHGEIVEANLSGISSSSIESVQVHEVGDWRAMIGDSAGRWFNGIFGAQPDQDRTLVCTHDVLTS